MIDAAFIDSMHSLPDTASIWTYAADRDLNPKETVRVAKILMDFRASWFSHGVPVESASCVLGHRFAVIAGHVPGRNLSGCGIDASVHVLEQASLEIGFEWLSALLVHYRSDDGTIHSVSRPDFRKLVEANRVHAGTIVFDLGIRFLGQLRAGRFERPARESWHGQAFGIVENAH